MSKRKKRWLIAGGAILGVVIAGIFIAASILSKRFKPLIREQAIRYLSDRFDSDVEIAALRIRTPKLSVPELILNRGKGTKVHVEGDGVSLRMRRLPDLPPVLAMRKFSFAVDLGELSQERKTVESVAIEGLRINIPPKGSRPQTGGGSNAKVVTLEDPTVRCPRRTIPTCEWHVTRGNPDTVQGCAFPDCCPAVRVGFRHCRSAGPSKAPVERGGLIRPPVKLPVQA